MRLQLIETLALASGSRGMVGGQAIDLAHVGRDIEITTLEMMHGMKTGALIRAAVRIGALLAGAGEENLARLDRFARHLGLAFQVQDDILDLCGDAAALGKQPGSDAALAKPTYATLLGADGAQRLSTELRDAALQELAPLGTRAAAAPGIGALCGQPRPLITAQPRHEVELRPSSRRQPAPPAGRPIAS